VYRLTGGDGHVAGCLGRAARDPKVQVVIWGLKGEKTTAFFGPGSVGYDTEIRLILMVTASVVWDLRPSLVAGELTLRAAVKDERYGRPSHATRIKSSANFEATGIKRMVGSMLQLKAQLVSRFSGRSRQTDRGSIPMATACVRL